MGSQHTIRTLANFKLPTGALVSGGNRIVENVDQADGDSLGQLGECINDLYALFRPPPLIWDGWQSNTTTSTTFVVIAAYRVPLEFVGTGNAIVLESVVAKVRARNTPAATSGEVRVSVFSGNGEARSTTVTVNSDTFAEFTLPDLFVNDSIKSAFVVLEQRAITGTLEVTQLRVDWLPGSVSMADGPYDNGFLPVRTDWGDLHEPASVERVRRLVDDLIIMAQTRGPGMILTFHVSPGESLNRKSGIDVLGRALVRQPPRATSAQVWVRGRCNTSGQQAFVTARISDRETRIGPFLFASAGNEQWVGGVVLMPYHDGSRSILHEFRLLTEDNALVEVVGICAWVEPISL